MDELIGRYAFPEPVYITRPIVPDLGEYQRLLEDVWAAAWLTNNGQMVRALEAKLRERSGGLHVSLFCNGTIALLVALQSLGVVDGEVITTPFTFPATAHALHWSGIRPVFCDIEPVRFNLDPNRIEAAINERTRAILPVHAHGRPCDVEAIQEIADRHGLRVIYDAAPAFGVRYRDRDLASYGDASMLSFHATKIFSTAEGGALMTGREDLKRRMDSLKNFGIEREDVVIGPGINGKMNEFEAAYGILSLDRVDGEIDGRRHLTSLYRRLLGGLPGITCVADVPHTDHNYAYFPILVDAARYGLDRDTLCQTLRRFNVYARKYYYPLCSDFPCYSDLTANPAEHLPVATEIAARVLCLPLFGDLGEESVRRISAILVGLHEST